MKMFLTETSIVLGHKNSSVFGKSLLIRFRLRTEAEDNSEMCYCRFLYSACKLVFLVTLETSACNRHSVTNVPTGRCGGLKLLVCLAILPLFARTVLARLLSKAKLD